MKHFLKSFLVLAMVVIWGEIHAQYCLPFYSIGCAYGDGITLFQLGTINQSVSCSGSPDVWYNDYTALSTNLTEGIDYSLTFQVGYENTYAVVYLDYDNDNDFTPSELVAQGIGLYAGTDYTMTINIPTTVPVGAKRLRILTEWGIYPLGPCFEYFSHYGNCSDFTVNAVSFSAGILTGTVTNCCNLAPVAGATVSCGGMTATTGPDGTYTIADIPPDTYTATCMFNNFYSTASAQVIINSNQTSTQDFCLNPDPPLVIDAGANQLVYYGYPPQACATLSGSGSGGIPPYTYLWNNGETTPSITVCPAVTTDYTVTITDATSCTFSDDVKVCVIDVRCGKNLDKVQICHIPPGTPDKPKTLCVAQSSVPAHLAHGDLLGACSAVSNCTDNKSILAETLPPSGNNGTIELETYPNPFSETAHLTFTCSVGGNVTIKLIDHIGKETAILFEQKVESEVLYHVEIEGSKLSKGLYFCVLQHSDGTMKINKLIYDK
jgi:hypothetical protein